MILTRQKIMQLGIVHNGSPTAQKHSTYNATVGEIISEGEQISAAEYRLPKRGMVWVVSREEFEMPLNVTGLATLKTTWTHDGILALNVGIVDPNWHGPLATALVNFSEKTFVVKKGEEFLRVTFHEHGVTAARLWRKPMDEYLSFIKDKSSRTANTFLNIKSLSGEVIDEVFTLPRWLATLTKWGVAFAVISALVALLAIFVPIAWNVAEKDWFSREDRLERLERKVAELEGKPTRRND